MTPLDERFEKARRELDATLPQPTVRPLDEFRRRDRRRRTTVALGLGAVVVVATVGGLLAIDGRGGAEPEPAPAATTSPASPRVRIATDLFAVGFAWLDGQNFDEPHEVGPFDVYELEDDTEPAYWYYKGMGVVPIGTRYDPTKTGETSTNTG